MKQHLLVATLTFVLGISTLAPALGQIVFSEESVGEEDKLLQAKSSLDLTDVDLPKPTG